MTAKFGYVTTACRLCEDIVPPDGGDLRCDAIDGSVGSPLQPVLSHVHQRVPKRHCYGPFRWKRLNESQYHHTRLKPGYAHPFAYTRHVPMLQPLSLGRQAIDKITENRLRYGHVMRCEKHHMIKGYHNYKNLKEVAEVGPPRWEKRMMKTMGLHPKFIPQRPQWHNETRKAVPKRLGKQRHERTNAQATQFQAERQPNCLFTEEFLEDGYNRYHLVRNEDRYIGFNRRGGQMRRGKSQVPHDKHVCFSFLKSSHEFNLDKHNGIIAGNFPLRSHRRFRPQSQNSKPPRSPPNHLRHHRGRHSRRKSSEGT